MSACPRADDAAAFALRLVTGAEAASFRHHLETCPACQLSLGEMSDAAALLPLAVPPEQPPPHVRAAIVDRVQREGRPAVASEPKPSRTRFGPWQLATAAVAGAAVMLLAMQMWQPWLSSQQQSPETPVPAPSIGQVDSAPFTYVMAGTPAAPAATAQVVCTPTPDGTRMTIVAEGLPPLAPGEAYQLWFHRSGQDVSVGVFVLDGAGRGGLATLLPGKPAFDALTVTREPDPFGLEPRGERLLDWSEFY